MELAVDISPSLSELRGLVRVDEMPGPRETSKVRTKRVTKEMLCPVVSIVGSGRYETSHVFQRWQRAGEGGVRATGRHKKSGQMKTGQGFRRILPPVPKCKPQHRGTHLEEYMIDLEIGEYALGHSTV